MCRTPVVLEQPADRQYYSLLECGLITFKILTFTFITQKLNKCHIYFKISLTLMPQQIINLLLLLYSFLLETSRQRSPGPPKKNIKLLFKTLSRRSKKIPNGPGPIPTGPSPIVTKNGSLLRIGVLRP